MAIAAGVFGWKPGSALHIEKPNELRATRNETNNTPPFQTTAVLYLPVVALKGPAGWLVNQSNDRSDGWMETMKKQRRQQKEWEAVWLVLCNIGTILVLVTPKFVPVTKNEMTPGAKEIWKGRKGAMARTDRRVGKRKRRSTIMTGWMDRRLWLVSTWRGLWGRIPTRKS